MLSRANDSPQSQELEALQRRYSLLEGDRKLSVEKGFREIQSNKDMIKTLTLENNRMREEVVLESKKATDEGNMDKLLIVKNRFNKKKSLNDRKIQKLNALQLKLQVEQRHVNVQSTQGSDSASRQVRVLENRIDKATIRYNDALAIRSTYEAIHKRLCSERIGADSVLAGIECEISTKKKETEELLSHCHESHHAKELAQAELHRFEQCVAEERNQMDSIVAEKKLLVQQRIEMNQKLEEKDRKNKSKRALPAEILASERPVSSSGDIGCLQELEIAFSKLVEITGVCEVGEIVQKFVHQEDMHAKLLQEAATESAALETARNEFAVVQRQLDELKFSANAPTKRPQEEREKLSQLAANKFAKTQYKYEHFAKLMIQVTSGISHLHAKLVPGSDSTLGVDELLSQCETAIAQLPAHTVENSSLGKPQVRIRVGHTRENVEIEFIEKEGPFDREHAKKISTAFVDERRKTTILA